ncbi:T9SS type A sorting domain-containing protein [uncultured Algibacter sp.]|uniref:T9SS type A sorting domain-containing protein n=1 Tax=uncultured Algibacter sp. TaxID=298659 RepID=UPI002638A916|nr:T9SS type A sorting domain-containing protein [uncultured Algibacter sp.]
MNRKLPYRKTKSQYLIYFFFLLISMQSFADIDCGDIEGFEFSNGHESVTLIDGGNYIFDELPTNFYVNMHVDGYSQSVKYVIENLETGERYKVTENLLPYTFPAGNKPWYIGEGKFKLSANLYKFDLGFGYCDSKSITFTIGGSCTADAGTLHATSSNVTLTGDSATISATPDGNINLPEGYSSIFVLTSGEGLVIEAVSATPEFTVTSSGLYTIHTLVYDGREDSENFLNLGIVEFGTTTGVDVLTVVTSGGLCASLDAAGAPIQVESCTADAGTLQATSSNVTLTGDSATISATPDGNINVPEGYSSIFVLTSGEGLVIEAVSATPEFTVTSSGLYTIHTLVYDGREDSANFLNLGIVEFGTTTGVDVLTVVTSAGLCASLDAAGAPIQVESCTADAGTLQATSSNVTLTGDSATISAIADGNINVPEGYSSIFVLTSGEGLVIEAVSATPEFTVTSSGLYTIHTLVYDGREDSANFLNLGIVEFGTTTGVDVLTVVTSGGLCASLDAAGSPIQVESCTADAGTLQAASSNVTLTGDSAMISVTPDGNINVPEGYSSIFVLTSGEGLVIEAVSATPEFTVTSSGLYTIHTLVYDGREDSANFLNLGIVEFGTTTGVDVLTVVTSGGLCASLDAAGSPIQVESCTADAGTLQAASSNVTLTGDSAMISVTPDGNINVPEGYSSIFVLTSGEGLVIEAVSATPEFTVTSSGLYTIHTLVYDGREDSANFLNLGIVEFGTTTGVDVLQIIMYNDMCASLDVAGAPVTVEEDICLADAGTFSGISGSVNDGVGTIEAIANDNVVVPDGYSKIFVLTSGEDLVIEQVNATPNFTVIEGGKYTVHTLVYDGRAESENFLDLNVVNFGETTGGDVLSIVTANGLCASLDVTGVSVTLGFCTADAGTLHATSSNVTLTGDSATISATPDGNINVPEGYSNIFVLTSGEGLVIEAVSATPEFTVTSSGLYTIHTLVYDGREDSANFLNLGIVEFGTTTGVDVLTVVTSAGLCASLDAAGAPVEVLGEVECTAFSGTMYSKLPVSCLNNGKSTITAKTRESAEVPNGFERLFVLTEAYSLTILGVSNKPSFEVSHRGFYRIHSLVYNPETLDLSVVVPGQTTGFDVVNLIKDNGICASLDVKGALNLVIGSKWFCYFFNKYFNYNSGRNDFSSRDGNENGLSKFVNDYNNYQEFKEDFIANNSKSKFFPNPVVNSLKVELELFENEVMNYSIIDVSGRNVMSGTATNLEFGLQNIDASRLNSGMYLVQFVSEYRTITKKIIVRK